MNSYDDDDDLLAQTLRRKKQQNDSDDEYGGLSFGSLNHAQKQMHKSNSSSAEESDSDSDDYHHKKPTKGSGKSSKNTKKKHKHAPTETSSKKPVSRIRKLPEVLNPKYANNLHQDIRFDAAYGKADLREARKNYAFLDDYRQQEINDLQKLIKDKKSYNLLLHHEQEETQNRLQSLKSRLDTLRNRDLEFKVLDDYKKEQLQNIEDGKQSKPYFLKRSEQRKLIQKAKFESMKPKQREKVIERKRKRKLGREFKQLEFRN